MSKKYKISALALNEMKRRSIKRKMVETIMANPVQKVPVMDNIVCYQSKVEFDGKTYLLRIMVNEDSDPPVVVTVYRTSKIGKYWRDI